MKGHHREKRSQILDTFLESEILYAPYSGNEGIPMSNAA